MKEFPTIGKYNKTLQQRGSAAFKSLNNFEIVPSRISPIKVFLHGSGAYAAVFKARRQNRTYALRCFLNSGEEVVRRMEMITSYLQNISGSWITSCELLNNEIEVEGNSYPVLKMEWIDGLLLNEFISKNLSNNQVLSSIQSQLSEISKNLEDNDIGHGDLQCGNIMVSGSSHDFKLRLIDYDGMYTPYLKNEKSLEHGRSEFQHPDRRYAPFDQKIDRFSFWVMITALEALKFDKALWKEVMQGGFNTLDNMLFKAEDFKNPLHSQLFIRLSSLNQQSLNFYLNNLKKFCRGSFSSITSPVLYAQNKVSPDIPQAHKKYVPAQPSGGSLNADIFEILTNEKAVVLTSNFQKLGNTPLQLNKTKFEGKTIIVSNGIKTRQVLLSSYKNVIELNFT